MSAFIQVVSSSVYMRHRMVPHMCEKKPTPPRDPTDLRSESERRRNQPPKPLRRRTRRRQVDDPLDWDKLPSVPLVRPEATPESGEDYWMDITDAKTLGDTIDEDEESQQKKPSIDENLRNRLKQEVVSPYTENWILRAVIIVAVLVVLVAMFGGSDKTPIIELPDL